MARRLYEWDYSGYPGAEKYPHLFSPIQIGDLIVPNRIKYAATEDNFNDADGFITDADVAYMRARAEGVVGGLCFMQGVYMDQARQGQGYVGQAACWDDRFIPGLRRIADAIHSQRAIAGFQLMDCGRVGAVNVDYCHGPSAVPQRLRLFKPVLEMTKVDYISVTVGWQESTLPVISRDVPMGSWLHLARRAKEHVKVPVQMAYRLFRPELPEQAIAAGELDMWEMCRSMIADPLMPKKVLEGREEEIRHCVACNLCLARLFRDAPMTCYINPRCAHEHDERFTAQPVAAEEQKEVMIIGAGPAGLECAYVAANTSTVAEH